MPIAFQILVSARSISLSLVTDSNCFELQELSDGGGLWRRLVIWQQLESIPFAIHFLDLGGHTADNYPALLSHRLASVQATCSAFAVTYANAGWWIVDYILNRWLANSYQLQKSSGLFQGQVFVMYLTWFARAPANCLWSLSISDDFNHT